MDQNTIMIEIFIFTFNRPDLLEIQVDCLKKFMINDFKVNVVHDSRSHEPSKEFKTVCEKLREKYDDLEVSFIHHKSEEGLSSSQYHANVLQWVYETCAKFLTDTICLFLDHDIFLIEKFDLIEEMNDCDIMGLQQERGEVKYIWPGLVAFKPERFFEMDWNCGEYYGENLDTGGGISKILKNEIVRYKNYNVEYPDLYKQWSLNDSKITFGYNFELHNDKFLHYRNACNWDTYYNLRDVNKTELLFSILKEFLDG